MVQTVSGATITNVTHTYTAANDTTTAISAKAEELLSTTDGVVKIGINAQALQDCTVAVTDVDLDGVDDDADDFSDITCAIAPTANVTSVRFVVNG